eukprot:TRINITY_DN1842_c0_g1_i3.p2 TRINITY_DN1842_c0_g1~~TRINITY_DN1842_c0_g1_i3.p2  ORF type:complete len:133 (-),score=15.67 TRINITY_DN1842_c0_g1_i3:102-500(-)
MHTLDNKNMNIRLLELFNLFSSTQQFSTFLTKQRSQEENPTMFWRRKKEEQDESEQSPEDQSLPQQVKNSSRGRQNERSLAPFEFGGGVNKGDTILYGLCPVSVQGVIQACEWSTEIVETAENQKQRIKIEF